MAPRIVTFADRIHKQDEAEAAFLLLFGKTLMSWSYIEHRLFVWFWHLSGMQEAAARAVFFSAKAFRSRSEMIQALLRSNAFPRKIKKLATFDLAIEFLRECLNTADNYSQMRNSLAHGVGMANILENDVTISLLQGGVLHFQAMQKEIKIDQIKIASVNFEKLSQLIARGRRLGLSPNGNLTLLQELYEQVLQLPNQPDCETLSQNQLGRLRQRESARRGAAKNLDPE